MNKKGFEKQKEELWKKWTEKLRFEKDKKKAMKKDGGNDIYR